MKIIMTSPFTRRRYRLRRLNDNCWTIDREPAQGTARNGMKVKREWVNQDTYPSTLEGGLRMVIKRMLLDVATEEQEYTLDQDTVEKQIESITDGINAKIKEISAQVEGR